MDNGRVPQDENDEFSNAVGRASSQWDRDIGIVEDFWMVYDGQ